MEIRGQTAIVLGGSRSLTPSAATDQVKFVDDLTKTWTGKTQKNLFKDLYGEEKEKKI